MVEENSHSIFCESLFNIENVCDFVDQNVIGAITYILDKIVAIARYLAHVTWSINYMNGFWDKFSSIDKWKNSIRWKEVRKINSNQIESNFE